MLLVVVVFINLGFCAQRWTRLTITFVTFLLHTIYCSINYITIFHLFFCTCSLFFLPLLTTFPPFGHFDLSLPLLFEALFSRNFWHSSILCFIVPSSNEHSSHNFPPSFIQYLLLSSKFPHLTLAVGF